MIHFVRIGSILCVLNGSMGYCYEEVENHEKVSFVQNIVVNGWSRDCTRSIPHSPPL